MLCILHCLGLWQEIASSSRHMGSLGSSWPTARVYYWAPDLNIWSKLSNRSDSFLNILLLSINPDINVITIVFLSECYMITPVLCLCIFQSRMPVLNLELNMQNIFDVLYFFLSNNKKIYLWKEGVPDFWKNWNMQTKLCATLWKDSCNCPPTPVRALWYGSFTRIERLLYIFYLFLWKP